MYSILGEDLFSGGGKDCGMSGNNGRKLVPAWEPRENENEEVF
jgi:hypothetical protein